MQIYHLATQIDQNSFKMSIVQELRQAVSKRRIPVWPDWTNFRCLDFFQRFKVPQTLGNFFRQKTRLKMTIMDWTTFWAIFFTENILEDTFLEYLTMDLRN
jgi:hypothetical protein